MHSTSRCGGFSLAESLVASVVLALAVVSVSSALIASQDQTAAQEQDTLAVSLARQLMEKVATLPLRSGGSLPGWSEGVTDPALYDSIGDFNGYRDVLTLRVQRSKAAGASAVFNTAMPPAVAETGSPAPLGPAQYRRTVAVSFPDTMFGTAVTPGDFAVITATVQTATGMNVTITRLVANANIVR